MKNNIGFIIVISIIAAISVTGIIDFIRGIV